MRGFFRESCCAGSRPDLKKRTFQVGTSTSETAGGVSEKALRAKASEAYASQSRQCLEQQWILVDREIYFTMLRNYYDTQPNLTWADWSMDTRLIVEVKDGHDHARVAEAIRAIEEFEVEEIRIFSEERDELRNEPYAGSFLLMLRTELILLVFVSFLAAGCIVYIGFFDKRREIATFLLKGTTKRQLYLLQLGESGVILIYSLIVGIITGIIGSWVWVFLFNSFDEEGEFIFRSYMPSFSMLPVVGVVALIVLLSSCVVAWRAQKIDLTKFIKWGG